MQKLFKNLIVAALVLGIIVFSGCIGGNEEESGSGTVETTLETTAKATTTTLEGVPGEDALESIVNLGKLKSYTVSYIMSSYAEGVVSTVSYTSYSKDDKLRIDFVNDDATDGVVEGRIYDLLESSYLCMYTEGQWACFGGDEQSMEEPGSETDAIDVDDILSQAEGSLLYTGEEEILGIQSKCFRSDVGGIASKFCVHPDYQILMKVETVGIAEGENGYMLMETKSLDLNAPEDSVFELPEGYMDMDAMLASLGDEATMAP